MAFQGEAIFGTGQSLAVEELKFDGMVMDQMAVATTDFVKASQRCGKYAVCTSR